MFSSLTATRRSALKLKPPCRSCPKLSWRRASSTTVKTVDLDYNAFIPENGNRRDRPLIILHGLFGSKRNWASLCKAFQRDLNRPVYALDLRNHGTSPHAVPMTYTRMAADVLRFVRAFKLSNISLLGHSMGGKVAMAFALNPNLPPCLLDNLIVADIAPSKGTLSAEFITYIKAMKEIEAAGVFTSKEALRILHRYEKDPSVCAFLLTNMGKSDGISPAKFRIPIDILGHAIDSLGSFPYEPSDAKWEGNTLFIKGEKSNYINHHNIPLAEEYFPYMKLETLDAGHWVHAERPDEFKKMVVDFILYNEIH